jgi:ankyrin repeat protein
MFVVLSTWSLLQGADLATKIVNERSPTELTLVDAIERKQWSDVDRIINRSSDELSKQLTYVQPDGMTALHWAVFHQKSELVGKLLLAGIECDVATKYGISPLTIACTQGADEIAKQLLDANADENYRLAGDETLLMLAARQGNPNTVRHLLDHGAKLNEGDQKGQTALMWAASAGNDQALQVLIDRGADVNTSLKSGFTAMMFAARDGKMNCVHRLLDAGVDIQSVFSDSKDQGRGPRSGMSALMMAVESGHFELALDLIERGADPNDDRSGFTPLHAITWVRKTKSGDDVEGDPAPRGSGSLSSLDFVRKLIAAGADVNFAIRKASPPGRGKLHMQGATPLLLASKTADLPLIKLLIEHGADAHCQNANKTTVVLAAAGIGTTSVDEEPGTSSEVIETLEFYNSLGLTMNDIDKNQESVMHGASYRSYPAVVEWLAAHGATPDVWNHENKLGWTPFEIAKGSRVGSVKPNPLVHAALEQAMQVR